MCPLYVSRLIGPGDRKSIAPMAKRLALGECDQLHHFIAAGVWDTAPIETELLVQADRLVGGSDAVLVIDDTAIPKKGTHSVGVAPQYASALGKTSNCQIADAGARRSAGHGGSAAVSSRKSVSALTTRYPEQQYLDLRRTVLETGIHRLDRMGTGTRSILGHQMRFGLAQGFPLLTKSALTILLPSARVRGIAKYQKQAGTFVDRSRLIDC